MGRRIATSAGHRLAAAVAVAAWFPAVAPAATQDQIQHAIDRGRDRLFALQRDGNWEAVPARDPKDTVGSSTHGPQWGGMTAVATLALLAAGVDANDPRLKQAVGFLRTADVQGNYALGIRAQVWGQLPAEPWARAAERADCQALLRGLHTTAGPGEGFYGYRPASPDSDFDHSVSQFGVLGMWSLAQAGVEVPTNYWRVVDAAWHHQQLADGSWAYYDHYTPGADVTQVPGTAMTAAGVATLYIAQEYTQLAPKCAGNIDDPAIDAGLKYLGDHLTELGAQRRWYTLFGVSRVGLASGHKNLGSTDWFQWGADRAVADQQADGSWHNTRDFENVNGVADTAFALLFLARGRTPVMMAKLQYDVVGEGKQPTAPKPGTWNQRPRDVANLARWVGRQVESPLAWQVVSLAAPPADLHDAPILYMSGSHAPKLSAADVDKLRAYAEDGGLILGHADCSSPDFAKGFERLGEQLFPAYGFRPLEPTSPIYTGESFPRSAWPSKPAIDALSNGARELMVLVPAGDPAKQWQGQSFQAAKRDVFGQLMIDLFLYAIDKQGLRHRGETYLVARHDGGPATQVRVARLRYAGNWDPEPGGWRRLANVLHNGAIADLDVHTADPAVVGQLDAASPLAVLTIGAADARLTDPARAAVRDYVKAGGTLLVDVAGGRSAYRSAAEAEIAKLFPDAPRSLPVLPPGAPLYAAVKGDLAVRSVDYRRFERPSGALHVPLLRAYTIAGRAAVLYSPEDVSVGLVGQQVDGVAGYTPGDATKVVAAVVAYAAAKH